MTMRPFFIVPLLSFSASVAVELPGIPSNAIAVKKELLFSDDFERADLGKSWGQVVPTYVLEKGTMKGTQTRINEPATKDKPAVVGHAAVIGTNIATKDSVVEFRFRFDGATTLSAEFDDRNFKGSHYGHICRVIITPKSITLKDERDGSMRKDIFEMGNDPTKRDQRNKLLEGRSVTFPVQLDAEKWYALALETVNDSMRAVIDGKPVAFLKSSGIAHTTKSKIEFGCAGKSGSFDDIMIWNAAAIK